jgi:hypothetical protein
LLLVDSVNKIYPNTGKSPRGPPTDLSYAKWKKPTNAPVWSGIATKTTAEEYCRTLIEVTDVSRTSPSATEVSIEQNVYYLIYFCVAVMMINVIGYTMDQCMEKPNPPLCLDEKSVICKPTWRSIAYMWRPAVLYTFFYVATMIGMCLFLSGYTGLADLIDKHLEIDVGSIIRKYIWTMCVLIAVIDTIFLIVVWIRTHNMLLCEVMMAYYDTIGNKAAAELWKKRRWFTRGGWDYCWGALFFNAMHATLLASFLLAALVAVFGCINIGLAYGLGLICTKVIGAVDNLCINGNTFAINNLRCGSEFQGFCNEFASADSVYTYWGAFIAVAGHYYLIASAGAAQQLCKEIQSIFYLLPSRSQYLEGITDLSESISTEEFEHLREEKESVREGAQAESVDEGDEGEVSR